MTNDRLADELERDYPAVDVTSVVFSRDFAGVGCCVIPQDRVLAVIAALRATPPAAPAGGESEAVAWLVLSEETGNTRIWWRDKARAEEWSRQHNKPLIPLYANPRVGEILPLAAPAQSSVAALAIDDAPSCGQENDYRRAQSGGLPEWQKPACGCTDECKGLADCSFTSA